MQKAFDVGNDDTIEDVDACNSNSRGSEGYGG